MTFFNSFQPENIIKIITRNMGFQPLIAVSLKKRLPKESLSKWWARLESNQRCFICHGFTVRCNRQLCLLTRVAESVGHEPNAVLAAHIA